MYICSFCKKSFNNQKLFSSHITRMEGLNFPILSDKLRYLCGVYYGVTKTEELVTQYLNEEISADMLNTSGFGKITELLKSMGKKRSNSEEKKTQRYRNKQLATIQDRYGLNITNVFQLQSVKDKKSNTYTAKYGSEEAYYKNQRIKMLEAYHSDYVGTQKHKDALVKAQQTCIARYGHLNFGLGSKAKEKSAITRKNTINSWSEDEKRIRTQKAREALTFESSLEKRIQKILIDLDEDFKKHVFLYGYNFDIMLHGRLLIEINGDFWHANPLIYKANDILLGDLTAQSLWIKDKKKIDKVTEKGYYIFTLWEYDMKRNTDEQIIYELKEWIENARTSKR